jgi:photosystem II stability/assembly factor-like uncharacterized protein
MQDRVWCRACRTFGCQHSLDTVFAIWSTCVGFVGRFAELCAGSHGGRDWSRIFHAESLENNVRIAALVNLDESIFSITMNLNPQEILQLPHILHVESLVELSFQQINSH